MTSGIHPITGNGQPAHLALPNPTGSTSLTAGTPRTASSEDWPLYRSVITKLYIGENYTLPQVMAVMKEKYGIQAT